MLCCFVLGRVCVWWGGAPSGDGTIYNVMGWARGKLWTVAQVPGQENTVAPVKQQLRLPAIAGGCMAIEDAFELAADLSKAVGDAAATGKPVNTQPQFQRYQDARLTRVSSIHGMAGMAAFMASTYKAYLGEGLGPLSFITDYHIPHPGRVMGRIIMTQTMPGTLDWVLGGHTGDLEGVRAPYCRLADRPPMSDDDFQLFLRDDNALAERSNADWLLIAERPAPAAAPSPREPALAIVGRGAATPAKLAVAAAQAASASSAKRFGLPPSEYKGVYLNVGDRADSVTLIGRSSDCHVVLEGNKAAERHARIVPCGNKGGYQRYMLEDLGSSSGTWVNGLKVERGAQKLLHAGDVLEFGTHPAHEAFTLKLQHHTYRTDEVRGDVYKRISKGAMVQRA